MESPDGHVLDGGVAHAARPVARKRRIERPSCAILTTFPIENQNRRVADIVALIKLQVTEMLLTTYTNPQRDVPVKSRHDCTLRSSMR